MQRYNIHTYAYRHDPHDMRQARLFEVAQNETKANLQKLKEELETQKAMMEQRWQDIEAKEGELQKKMALLHDRSWRKQQVAELSQTCVAPANSSSSGSHSHTTAAAAERQPQPHNSMTHQSGGLTPADTQEDTTGTGSGGKKKRRMRGSGRGEAAT
jgi:hypothetical protein